ncbi:DUF488 family protein [Vogesella sp. LIG4]|uniref:DUF488 family protein, N3 subclade n=1 Tax=Vogesella sp. LIG4 TaxID=1192162 RepID=UPI0008201ED0|nr:DUF488 family protein [Vogesella sp. LIG4]SCK12377.1 Uncharacterized conserved protein YeaO, DUF488 family [Vogesella sp. LIG4]
MASRIRLLAVADYCQRADNVFLITASWPTGLPRRSITRARWLPRVAPADGLLAWLRRDEGRWPYFCDSYWADLAANPARWQPLIDAVRQYGEVVLLHDTPMVEANPVVALVQFLEARLAAEDWRAGAACLASPVCYAAETLHGGEL